MNVDNMGTLKKKPQGTKSVREASTRKHDDIGSFTENLSYFNEVNALSHQPKTNLKDPSIL